MPEFFNPVIVSNPNLTYEPTLSTRKQIDLLYALTQVVDLHDGLQALASAIRWGVTTTACLELINHLALCDTCVPQLHKILEGE